MLGEGAVEGEAAAEVFVGGMGGGSVGGMLKTTPKINAARAAIKYLSWMISSGLQRVPLLGCLRGVASGGRASKSENICVRVYGVCQSSHHHEISASITCRTRNICRLADQNSSQLAAGQHFAGSDALTTVKETGASGRASYKP